MRRELLPALLRRVEYNLARGNRDVRLFEIGTSFSKAGSGEPPHEETRVAAVLTGRREPPHWSRPDEALELWDLKGLLDDIAKRVYHAGDVTVTPGTPPTGALDEGASFVVTHDGAIVGHGGRVATNAVDVPVWTGDVWALEITLPRSAVAPPPVTYRKLPQHPASERDLALLVPLTVESVDVSRVIRAAAGPELEALDVFDLYSGEGIPAGTRSLAFRLRFRSSQRTLKDKEVDRSVASVLKRLEEELGVKVRG